MLGPSKKGVYWLSCSDVPLSFSVVRSAKVLIILRKHGEFFTNTITSERAVFQLGFVICKSVDLAQGSSNTQQAEQQRLLQARGTNKPCHMISPILNYKPDV